MFNPRSRYPVTLFLLIYTPQDYERMNLADALQSKKFNDGECVIKQVKIIIIYTGQKISET